MLDECQRFVEKWLKHSQCKDKPRKAKQIAKKLADTERYLSQGTVIDYKEASKELKLNVNSLPPDSSVWQAVWYLCCNHKVDM